MLHDGPHEILWTADRFNENGQGLPPRGFVVEGTDHVAIEARGIRVIVACPQEIHG